MRVAITTVKVPFVRGGAESHAGELKRALAKAGHEVDIISMPFKWYPAERLVDMMAMWRMLDLSSSNGLPIDRVIALKFPAYLATHPNQVLWILHQHREAYESWDDRHCALAADPLGKAVRDLIHEMDQRCIPKARDCYVNSRTVQQRLFEHTGLSSKVLYHPPPQADELHRGGYGDYILLPGRINEAKRQALVIEALFLTKAAPSVVIMGQPDRPEYGQFLRTRAAPLGKRVHWSGYVDDKERIRLFAEARAVLFPPHDEDYGYGTLEAMLSGKAVLTCSDSGGPLEFVQDGVTGLVCSPDPKDMAEVLDRVWTDGRFAERAGEAAYERYQDLGISWDHVLSCLLD